MQLITEIQAAFEKALEGWVDDASEYAKRIAVAKDPKHGDYQANIAMPLKQVLSKPPLEIANELVERLEIGHICHEPEIAGPGFINLRLKDEFVAEQLNRVCNDERLSVASTTSPKTYVIDYSSPNVAKPMHVGHIRTTVIGDCIARVLRFLGHKVITDNHLGDWGTQFGMIIYGYKNFVDAAAFEAEPVKELSRIYRVVQAIVGYQSSLPKIPEAEEKLSKATLALEHAKASPDEDAKKQKKILKAAEKSTKAADDALKSLRVKVSAVDADPKLLALANEHPEIEKRSQLETAKLHAGDEENLELWKKFLPISITEIDSAYDRLGVKFDHTFGESFYHPMLADIVNNLVSKGVAKEDEGAICVFLEEFDSPMIIQKRDGAFLYSTTDLATIEYRMSNFAPDAILYVVDHRQSEHFEKLFVAARVMGYGDVELSHVSFGTVLGKDGRPFKTRSGTVMGLDYLLDEAVERAFEVVCDEERLESSGIDLSDDEKRNIANVVGLGAIKYADLSHNRTSDYKFDIKEMVKLEGDTSTYIQYMYARACSIMRKSEMDISASTVKDFKISVQEAAERKLALQLLQFEDALLQSMEEYYPSVLAGYLFGLAKQFATFFNECHVLKAENDELKQSRLAICYTTANVLKQGLGLLGIGVVPKM